MERLFYHPTAERTPAPTWLHPRAEAFWFHSEDATRLRAWFVPAHVADPRQAPTSLQLHGNAGSMVSHVAVVEHLPAAGFNVMLFDYRGYGESEGTPTSRAPLVADARAALTALRARSDVDPDRVALVGQSLGGAIAAVVMADDLGRGGECRAAVLESPFASWREVAASAVGGDPPPAWARLAARWLIPDATPGVPRPVDAVAAVPRPVLILHGDADSIVPVSHGRRMADAAPLGELEILDGGEHNTLQQTHPEARRRMVEFLRRHTAASVP